MCQRHICVSEITSASDFYIVKRNYPPFLKKNNYLKAKIYLKYCPGRESKKMRGFVQLFFVSIQQVFSNKMKFNISTMTRFPSLDRTF
jgi:hypothetical protein